MKKERETVSSAEAKTTLEVSATSRVWRYWKAGELEGFMQGDRLRLYADSVAKLAKKRKELAELGLLNINPKYHATVLLNRKKNRPARKAGKAAKV